MSGLLFVDILRSATQDDMVIKRICKFVEAYSPNRIDTNYKPYYDKRDELSLKYGILMSQVGLLLQACQQNRRCEPEHPLMNWPIPNSPWQRNHANFAGPVDGEMYLVMVWAMTNGQTNTPHASTRKFLAFMLYGRRLCTMFDRIRPTPALTARKAIDKYKLYRDTATKCRSFQPGQTIWYHRHNEVSWQPAKVESVFG
ncbi:hypothetical protein GJ496_004827 [Pomphorhynchus laevis]|nr:hypothetical protein GJ496_004827 [Pomphorhynchus laevis]